MLIYRYKIGICIIWQVRFGTNSGEMFTYLGNESFKCFSSMFLHISLCSSKNIVLLTKYVLPRNIPHLRSSWYLRHLWHLWIHVEWSKIMSINMCCSIKVRKNQPTTQYQLCIRPNWKPEIRNYKLSITKTIGSWKL